MTNATCTSKFTVRFIECVLHMNLCNLYIYSNARMEDDAVFVPLLVEYGILILLFIVCRRQLYESVALENLILLKRKYKRALLNERKKEI